MFLFCKLIFNVCFVCLRQYSHTLPLFPAIQDGRPQTWWSTVLRPGNAFGNIILFKDDLNIDEIGGIIDSGGFCDRFGSLEKTGKMEK